MFGSCGVCLLVLGLPLARLSGLCLFGFRLKVCHPITRLDLVFRDFGWVV